MAKLEDFDQPIIFLFAVTIGVIGMMAVMSWLFVKLKWTGPLSLIKGGVVPS
jgi:hypothetical protein